MKPVLNTNKNRKLGAISKKKPKIDYKTRHNIGSRIASDKVVTYSESGRSIYDTPIYTDYSQYESGGFGLKALKSVSLKPILKREKSLTSSSNLCSPKCIKLENNRKSSAKTCDRSTDDNSAKHMKANLKSKENKGVVKVDLLDSDREIRDKEQNKSVVEKAKSVVLLKPQKFEKLNLAGVGSKTKIKLSFEKEEYPNVRNCKKENKDDQKKAGKIGIKMKKVNNKLKNNKLKASSAKCTKKAVAEQVRKNTSQKSKYPKPKKHRLMREASLNATAVMNLLYLSSVPKKLSILASEKATKPKIKKVGNIAFKSNKGQVDKLVKKNSSMKANSKVIKTNLKESDKSKKPSLKQSKTQRLKRSRELKSLLPCGQTINRKFLKTFDKQPGVWTHERRLASLNAQAILSASKEIDFRKERGWAEKMKEKAVMCLKRQDNDLPSAKCSCSNKTVSTVSHEVIEMASENLIQTTHTTVEKSVPEVYKVTQILTKDSIKGHWVTQQVHRNGSASGDICVDKEQNTIKWSNKKLIEKSAIISDSSKKPSHSHKIKCNDEEIRKSEQKSSLQGTDVVVNPNTTIVSGNQSLLVNNSSVVAQTTSTYPYSHSSVMPTDSHCQRLTIGGMGSISNFSVHQPSSVTYPQRYPSAFATCGNPYYTPGYFQPAGPMIQAVPDSYFVHHPMPIPVSQSDVKIIYHAQNTNQNLTQNSMPLQTVQPSHVIPSQYTPNINLPVPSVIYNTQVEMNPSLNILHQNPPIMPHHSHNYHNQHQVAPSNECSWPPSNNVNCNQWQVPPQQPMNDDCNWQTGTEYWQNPQPSNWHQQGSSNWQNNDYSWQSQQIPSHRAPLPNCDWSGQQQYSNYNGNWPEVGNGNYQMNTDGYNDLTGSCMVNISEPAEAPVKSSDSSIETNFSVQLECQKLLPHLNEEETASDLDIDVVGTDERRQADSFLKDECFLPFQNVTTTETSIYINDSEKMSYDLAISKPDDLKTKLLIEKHLTQPSVGKTVLANIQVSRDTHKCIKVEDAPSNNKKSKLSHLNNGHLELKRNIKKENSRKNMNNLNNQKKCLKSLIDIKVLNIKKEKANAISEKCSKDKAKRKVGVVNNLKNHAKESKTKVMNAAKKNKVSLKAKLNAAKKKVSSLKSVPKLKLKKSVKLKPNQKPSKKNGITKERKTVLLSKEKTKMKKEQPMVIKSKRKSKTKVENDTREIQAISWKWIGKPDLKPVYPVNDGPQVTRKCYNAIQHVDGDVVNVRDCVLIKSGPRKKDLPYVAKISNFWENSEGDMIMSLLWYYRPEHTECGRLPSHMACELFASRHRDENSIACIEDKCYVLTFNQFCRYQAYLKMIEDRHCRRLSSVPQTCDMKLNDLPINADPQNVFICKQVYDFRQKRIPKNPT